MHMSSASTLMNTDQRMALLERLGALFVLWGNGEEWPGHACGLSATEFEEVEQRMTQARIHNGWFDEGSVRRAFRGLGHMLRPKALDVWRSKYEWTAKSQRTIGLVFAGNLPLVGMHDLICVWATGHRAKVKLSRQDQVLPRAVVGVMALLDPRVLEAVELLEGALQGQDAVIATGSNNTGRYFQQYFGDRPHIIRRNRNSVAVLDGTETEEELQRLGNDIFDFYGLGCRSVSKLFIPQDFVIDRFFEAVFGFSDVINHHKYANNYDYIRAIWLLNQEHELLDNGFLMLKTDEGLASPTGSLYVERYPNAATLEKKLEAQKDALQVIVGHGHLPFGQAQQPELWDYADHIDTVQWLLDLA